MRSVSASTHQLPPTGSTTSGTPVSCARICWVQSATLALRTQQILAQETGVPDVVDPVGGSWCVEALTERIEREARVLVDEIEQEGGGARAVERGVFQEAIARSAYAQQRAIEAGEAVVVGVDG